jgi:hexulose-6-phosphate isomerase
VLGEHLLGIYEKALDAEDDWYQRMEKARELGFDFLEISIDETDERLSRIYGNDREIYQIQDAARKAGVFLQSMCLSVHRRFPFGSADPEIRKKAADIMERALVFADKIGIRVIQLAGYDVYYEPSTDESKKRYEEGMAWAASRAARYQVMLGTEIMDIELMNCICKHLVYEEKIGSPWYKVYPDVGNISAWGIDPLSDLEAGIHSIVGVHLKDTLCRTADKPGVFRDVPFGQGCVDFAACLGKLEALGYTGPYMIEMWHKKGQDDGALVREAKAFIEKQYQKGIKM